MGDFPGALVVKHLPVNVGDLGEAGLSPGSGGAPGEGEAARSSSVACSLV